MIVLAVIIVIKGLRKNIQKKDQTDRLITIFGGFMDAISGGGWGPIVAIYLGWVRAGDPKVYDQFLSIPLSLPFHLQVVLLFLLFDGIKGWQVIAGLMIGD